MSDGYRPTANLRQQEVFDVRGVKYALQQLWVSIYEGEDAEWRDVEIIPWITVQGGQS